MEHRRPIRVVLSRDTSQLTLSSDQQYFSSTSRCPRCHKMLFYSRTYEPSGRVRRVRAPTDPASLAECPRCNQRWFYYRQPAELVFVETHQSTEDYRYEEMEVDNSRGLSSVKRSRSVSEEWTQSYTFEREDASTQSVTAKVGVDAGPSVEVMAEQALKERFAISEQKTRIFTEEVSIDVPPGVLSKVKLTFKRTWQHGRIEVTPPEGEPVEIPFQVVCAVWMNVTPEDKASPAAVTAA